MVKKARKKLSFVLALVMALSVCNFNVVSFANELELLNNIQVVESNLVSDIGDEAKSIEEGLVEESLINETDDLQPLDVDSMSEADIIAADTTNQLSERLSKETVRESLVLLKNEDGIVNNLLNSNLKSILVAGQAANSLALQSGDNGLASGTTLLEGFRQAGNSKSFTYSSTGKLPAIIKPSTFGAAIVVIAADEAGAVRENDKDVLKNVLALKIPAIVITLSAAHVELVDYIYDDNFKGLISAGLPGSEGGAVGEVLFDETYDFVGKLPISWPYYSVQLNNNYNDNLGELFKIGAGLNKNDSRTYATESGDIISQPTLIQFGDAALTDKTPVVLTVDEIFANTGDYKDYPLTVETAGTYNVDFAISDSASARQNAIIALVDGKVANILAVPNGNGTVNSEIYFAEGSHTLRVYASGTPWALNSISFTYKNSTGSVAVDKVVNVNEIGTTTVKVSDFSDFSVGDNGIALSSDGSLTDLSSGKWASYIMNVTRDGDYEIAFGVSNSATEDGKIVLLVDDIEIGAIEGITSSQTTKLNKIITLASASKVLTIKAESGNLTIKDIQLTAPEGGEIPDDLRDFSQDVKDKAEAMLAQMTLEEKVGQMLQPETTHITVGENSHITEYKLGSVLAGGGAFANTKYPDLLNRVDGWRTALENMQEEASRTRLGIPIIFGIDSVHGANKIQYATVFPHNVSFGAIAAGNLELGKELTEKAGAITAMETRAAGIPWTFAPVLGVPLDIRWGRAYEGFAEDFDLVTELSTAAIIGMQGENPREDLALDTKIVATAKHYLGEGASRNGRNQGDATLTAKQIVEEDIIPYRSAVDAGVRSLMPSFSSINGIKMHGHKTLLNDILKGHGTYTLTEGGVTEQVEGLGFNGFVITDWAAVRQLPESGYKNQLIRAVNAGNDMIMATNHNNDFIDTYNGLISAVNDDIENPGTGISMNRIDDAVRRILRVKYELGLFDNPVPDESAEANFGTEENKAVAREAVASSLVLLKNSNDIIGKLSSNPKIKNIFVAGVGADDSGMQNAGWTIDWQGGMDPTSNITLGGDRIEAGSKRVMGTTTLIEGFREVAPNKNFEYYEDGKLPVGKKPANFDAAIIVVGEAPYAEGNGDKTTNLAYRAADKALLDPSNSASADIQRLKKAGIPIIVLMMSGRPVDIADEIYFADGFVQIWLPGTEGAGVADVLFGDKDFIGKLPYTWPWYVSQLTEDGWRDGLGANPKKEFIDELGGALFKYGAGLKKGESGVATDNGRLPTLKPKEIILEKEPLEITKSLPSMLNSVDFSEKHASVSVTVSHNIAAGVGENLSGLNTGRWADYKINVKDEGIYKLDFTVLSANGAPNGIVAQLNGIAIGRVAIPATTSGSNWSYAKTTDLITYLPKGLHTLRIYSAQQSWVFHNIQFTYQKDADETEKYIGKTFKIDEDVTKINAVDFKNFALGTTITNIAETEDKQLNNFNNGRWVEYSIDVAEAGLYDVVVDYSRASADGSIEISVDGVVAGSRITLPATDGEWSDSVAKTINLSAGLHTLRIASFVNSTNLRSLTITSSNLEYDKDSYKDPNNSPLIRAKSLLLNMTTEEKIAQTTQASITHLAKGDVTNYKLGSVLSGGGATPDTVNLYGSLPNSLEGWRSLVGFVQEEALATDLKIPVIYGIDAVHGHNNVRGAVMFPHNIGLGAIAAGNMADAERIVKAAGAVTAEEVRATNIPWTFAPVVGIPRDIRWGRTYEGFSEDMDIVTKLGVAAILGLQGDDISELKGPNKVAATMKHYLGEGSTVNGTNKGNALLTEEEVFSEHLPPYTAATQIANSRTLMPSYSSINGIKMHEYGKDFFINSYKTI